MIKGYFKPTPRKLLQISLALRGLIGTISGAAYFEGNKDAAFWFLIAGAVIDFLIQCQKGDDNIPGYIQRVLLLLVGTAIVASGCGHTRAITSTDKVVDSSWVTKVPVEVPVKGGATPAVNMDSLKQALTAYLQSFPRSETLEKIRNFYIPDTSGRYELRYWMNAAGEIMAQCEAKDGIITAMVAQQNRLVKEKQTVSKETVKIPMHIYIIGVLTAGMLMALIIIIIRR